ncbi:uncharacterized protein BP5553_03031 [Venustampulla echinocandica]|uniref:Uncharacterized protein n=1 Tax=Venustampulla echinocandica TaxID=2656787 RepID=A0A370TT28_9HELO|nr:uncharacterized protein BP5553_03031 [Venustampulla echinocandica]RDL38691.1 hypothetical protein BP5553_03031 [Venustampulla echinocandica]
MDANPLDGHDREVLRPRVVREAKRVPEHHIGIADVVVAGGPHLDPAALAALVRVVAGGIQLAVAILGDPHGMLGVARAAGVEAVLGHDDRLARHGLDLVGDVMAAHAVDHAVVADLEHARHMGVGLPVAGPVDNRRARDVAAAVRVAHAVLLLGHGHAVLVDDGVREAVHGRVDAHGEEVLVVRRRHAGPDVSRPRHLAPVRVVDGDRGQDARGPHLQLEAARLVEHPREDIFVVGQRAHHLRHQLPVPHHGRLVVAVVGVLVQDAGVLLVEADDILQLDRVAARVGAVAIEVLDVAETIAAQAELVRRDTQPNIAHVKRLLPVERLARVSIGNRHFRDGQSIENVAPVVRHVVQNEPLPVVEADPEPPLLPLHEVAVHVERRAVGLLDDVRLEIRAQRGVQEVVRVLDRLDGLPWLRLRDGVVGPGGQMVDPHQFPGVDVEDGREGAGQRVVVGLRVVDRHNVHVALAQPARFGVVLPPIYPRIGAHGDPLGQLQLLDFVEHLRVLQADLLDLDHLVDVRGALRVFGELLERDDRLRLEVHPSMEEDAVVEALEETVCDAGRGGGQRLSSPLGLDVLDHILLHRLLDVERLEPERHVRERFTEKPHSGSNFIRLQGVEWVKPRCCVRRHFRSPVIVMQREAR